VTQLVGLLEDALRDPDPRTGIARAKLLIRNRLQETEPKAEIRETEYFDHSFAPDLLLRPPGGGSGSERWVFLRTTSDPAELADDLEVVPQGGTLFVSLDAFPRGRREPFQKLDRASSQYGSLVIDAPALDQVSDSRVRQTSTALMARALVAAGRGALGEAEAHDVLESFSAGVGAAINGDPEPTRIAVERASRQLATPEASQVVSFLGALWEGGGRSRVEFPGVLGAGGLGGAGLAILLDGPDLPNDPLWQRLAERTVIDDIVGAVSGSPDNLQRLLKGGIDKIKAHVCLVDREESALWDDTPPWHWTVRGGRLGLQGPGFTAYVAAKRDELPAREVAREAIDLAELRARARRFGITLREIRMRTPHRTVGYDSPSGDDIVNDRELDEIGVALGDHSVAHVETQVFADQRLACDLLDGTAGMVSPRTQVPVGRIVGAAIRLLEPLTDTEAERLRVLLQPLMPPRPYGPTWEQRALFDEDPN
jgi:hypothetical protein